MTKFGYFDLIDRKILNFPFVIGIECGKKSAEFGFLTCCMKYIICLIAMHEYLSQSYHITAAARARQMPCRSRRRRTLLYLGLEWQQTSLACRAAAQVPLKLCLASYGSVKCRLGYSCGKSWSRQQVDTVHTPTVQTAPQVT